MPDRIDTKEMDEKQWLRERQNFIGSSDAAAIMGLNKWKTPLEVYMDKINPAPIKDEEPKRLRRGKQVEAFSSKIFEEDTGFKTQKVNAILVNSMFPFMAANLDRLIVKPDNELTPGVLELKNTERMTVANWEDGEPPLYYWVQVQHQLAVTGYLWGYNAFLISGWEMYPYYIRADEQFIQKMIEEEERFWEDHVRKEIPPPPRSADDIAKLYPVSMQDKAVEAAEDLFNIYSEAYALHLEIKEKEKKLKDKKEQIIMAMGDAEFLNQSGETLVTYKTSSSFNEKKFQDNHPDIAVMFQEVKINKTKLKTTHKALYAQYSERTGSRKFLFK